MPDHDNLLTAKAVRDLFGGISDMTLWRWLQDEKIGFPQPVVIRRRRYWRPNEIAQFQARHVGGDA